MFYREMKKTENSKAMKDYWQNYRNTLTNQIIANVESYRIKNLLVERKELRINEAEEIKKWFLQNKPTLAIWGAGDCSDIDVEELSKYFQLVLIDCEREKINQAVEEKKISHCCNCLDLKFWDVPDEEYEMFEAMLIDGVDVKNIGEYLLELSDRMHDYQYNDFLGFDYSVIVGLASQLNVRFMALLELYCNKENNNKKIYALEEKEYLVSIISELNGKAVKRLFNLVKLLTKNLIIYGYESVSHKDIDVLEIMSDELNEAWSQSEKQLGDILRWVEENKTDIMGSRELEKELMVYLTECPKCGLFDFYSMVWNFLPEKNYLMLMFALEKPKDKFLDA